MPINHSLGNGMFLTPLNSFELSSVKSELSSRCVMCREKLDKETKTEEHIFPKWLQHHFNLWDKTLTLPNGSSTHYRQFTVPCCKQCNGEAMSRWEQIIQNAVQEGYREFVKVNDEIVVWWLLKIYYSKLVKENMFKEDIKNPLSTNLISDDTLAEYGNIYYYMCELLKGIKFNDPKPYELYIFQADSNNNFDYIDDISCHVLYMQMNDILLVCTFDSFNFFKMQYERELKKLKTLEKVYPLQAIELFVKIVYFKSHYCFDTKHSYLMKEDGAFVNSEIINLKQIRDFDLKILYDMLTQYFRIRGYTEDLPEYKGNSMISLI